MEVVGGCEVGGRGCVPDIVRPSFPPSTRSAGQTMPPLFGQSLGGHGGVVVDGWRVSGCGRAGEIAVTCR